MFRTPYWGVSMGEKGFKIRKFEPTYFMDDPHQDDTLKVKFKVSNG